MQKQNNPDLLNFRFNFVDVRKDHLQITGNGLHENAIVPVTPVQLLK